MIMARLHILQTHRIFKAYAQGQTILPVLQGISIKFLQGTSYAITGVSGSGKSTLMHILAGLEHPDAGEVLFNEISLQKFSAVECERFRNQSIGLVFQKPYMIQELTVLENVMLKGLIAGMSYEECHDQAVTLVHRMGLMEKIAQQPASLSGGQQQRVALARALFNKPLFLLADEPTGNLDHATATSMLDFILECQQTWSMGLIISSHDPLIANAVQEVWHLQDGVLQRQHKATQAV